MTIALVRSDTTRLVATVGLSVLTGLCGVGLLATSAWLLSRAAEHPPVLYLMVAIVGVRAFGLGRAVFRYAERLVGHDVALRLQGRLRARTYAALSRSAWLGRRGGDVLSRVITDVAAIQDLVVRAVVPVLSATVVLTAAITVIMIMLPAAGLVVLGASVVGGAVVPVVAGRLAARAEQSLAPLRGRLAAVIGEADRAAIDLILFDATWTAARAADDVDAELRRAEQRTAFWSGWAAAGQVLATGVAVLGALWAGASAVAAGTVAPVLLAVLALTPLALHEVLATLPPAVQAWTRSRSALGRVDDLLAAPPIGAGGTTESAETTGADDPGRVTTSRIELTRVSVGWPGAAPVVVDLDLTVRAGERVALVGPSGVGKTTVAATVLGLLAPVAGSVTVRGSVGYLAQDAHVFDTTVAENTGIGRRGATAVEIETALRAARLPLPPGRLVGANGNRLSGGEQRRLALSRLLLRDDAVIVLDEPTEHIDRPTADALVADLWDRTTGRAVLVITHDPVLIARCDRVVELVPAAAGARHRCGDPSSPQARRPCPTSPLTASSSMAAPPRSTSW